MEKKLIFENIICEDGGHSHLLGGRCKKCGRISFPRLDFCIECLSEEVELVPLSRKGKLYSYTTTMMQVSGMTPPFSLGYIDLPENVRVFSPISKITDAKFEVGQDMCLEICELWKEDDTSVVGFRFVPENEALGVKAE